MMVRLLRASLAAWFAMSLVMACSATGVAWGDALAPWWGVGAGSRPSVLQAGRKAQIVVSAENLGDADANGEVVPIRVEDTLPTGLTATSAEGFAGDGVDTTAPFGCVVGEPTVVCTFGGVLRPYQPLEVRIEVVVKSDMPSGQLNTVSVSGGGAVAGKTARRPMIVGHGTPFGLQENMLMPEEAGGAADTQAGSHPFQVTDTLMFNQGRVRQISPVGGGHYPAVKSVGMPRDVSGLLPPGLLGNPAAFVQCTDQQFVASPGGRSTCPLSSVVGVAEVTFDEPITFHIYKSVTPIFNLVPNAGEPARFGFNASIEPVTLDTSVRTGGDYGVTVTSHNTSEAGTLLSSRLTFWGVPGDSRHDGQRGFDCLEQDNLVCPDGGGATPPYLSMPTMCTGPLEFATQLNSWEEPGEVLSFGSTEPLPAMDGCNHLSFAPSISAIPDVQAASTPTGLAVGVHLPQTAALDPTGLAQSTLRDTTVALPEGVAVDPSGGDGLQACTVDQVGFLPEASVGGELHFTPAEAECPNGSKVGTVKIKTPILPNPLEGAVYLGAQDENPFGSLVAMYLVAEDRVSGTLLKLAGEVALNERTGQIVSTFNNSPPLPFEDVELHFFGGERAPLSTPARCGTYSSDATFVPWSGNGTVQKSAHFEITTGPADGPCPGPALPFAPSLTGGTTSVEAGGLSPFAMTMGRPDGNQSLQAISLRMPPGITGVLSSVALCAEAQANAGTCGPESLIGETTVSAGLGNDPYTVRGGKVYLTGPYEGAPFGLSIVNPAKAGPFDLERQQPCDCLVVRAKVEVDPRTAELTIKSDRTGPYAIPSMLRGIPLQIKHVNVTINRPAFTLNPTSCKPMAISANVQSAEGAAQVVTVPFRVTNCAALRFSPKLEASTSAKASRLGGASLAVKLVYPRGPLGTYANIAKVKVELPKRLPSRLRTLQKACTAAQFDANPAGCPAASIVGHARATTPILPVPLEGPAYFVSHGGEAFPSLIIVLQGYGVTVELVGTTFISKRGITSSTFKTVPDVPVGSFALSLPQGPYSALAANGNLCKHRLLMPTEFTAQSGAVVHERTVIEPTHCKKSRARAGQTAHQGAEHTAGPSRKDHRKSSRHRRG